MGALHIGTFLIGWLVGSVFGLGVILKFLGIGGSSSAAGGY